MPTREGIKGEKKRTVPSPVLKVVYWADEMEASMAACSADCWVG